MPDFSNAQNQQLEPLQKSHAVDDFERQIKQLFFDLFDAHIADALFDANVLGMAHLGSHDLIRRFVTFDGLALLPSEHEEASARYIYRAWKARNMQGRGLFFLKTYLQALFPGAWNVEQQMQLTAAPYPTALSDRSIAGDSSDHYLTSRLHIKLDYQVIADPSPLLPVIESILPARFIPRVYSVAYTETNLSFGAIGSGVVVVCFSGDVIAPSYALDAEFSAAATMNGIVVAHFEGEVVR